MNGWGLFSLVVVAVPVVAIAVWVYSEHESNRRRRKFLRRYRQRSVAGIRRRVERDLATEITHVMPKLPRSPLQPDPLQDGQFTGDLSLPKRIRGYTRKPIPHPRPDTDVMRRVIEGLRRL